MKKWPAVALLAVGATILGATVLSAPIASAAHNISATIVGPLDGQGNVKVHEQGIANVNVVGNVPTQEGIPATEFSRQLFGRGLVTGPDPAGTNYAITSITSNNRTNFPASAALSALYGSTSDCATFQQPLGGNISNGPTGSVLAHETLSLTFPQPFVIEAKSGANSCLFANAPIGVEFTVVGYRF